MNDPIHRIIAQWQHERPDLDPTPMGTVGRILRLSTHLRERVETALIPFELSLWQFDVLATLRRNGPPFRMSPKELMTDVMLSSGAMTNRLDRLEASGYIARLPDPNDRRGVQIELTERGRALVDQAIAARFSEAAEVVTLLDTKERTELEAALRKLLTALEAGERHSA